MFDFIIHRLFKRPYRLAVPLNEISNKPPTIVFLHGIASSSKSWVYVLGQLPVKSLSLCCIDLLGFGRSPKPQWKNYDTNDHADSVIATIKSLKIRGPIVLVGHSMGGIVAVEVAKRLGKRKVRKLILVGTPLYKTSPLLDINGSLVELIETSLYRTIYDTLSRYRFLSIHAATIIQKYFPNVIGFEINKKNWTSFKKSLIATIEHQTTLKDIETIHIPTVLLYGKKDRFIINSYHQDLSKKHAHIDHIEMHGPHELTHASASMIVTEIMKVLQA